MSRVFKLWVKTSWRLEVAVPEDGGGALETWLEVEMEDTKLIRSKSAKVGVEVAFGALETWLEVEMEDSKLITFESATEDERRFFLEGCLLLPDGSESSLEVEIEDTQVSSSEATEDKDESCFFTDTKELSLVTTERARFWALGAGIWTGDRLSDSDEGS